MLIFVHLRSIHIRHLMRHCNPYFLLFSAACLFLNSSCKNKLRSDFKLQDVIRIGEVQTLTGPEAGIGLAIHEGIELAIQELNSTGGIQGKPLELLTLDDQGKGEEAAAAATKLITHHHVSALLGASASSRSRVVADVAQGNKIPMITPTSTHPEITTVGNYVFRICFIDSFQGKVMADFALKKLEARRLAILRDIKSDYSVGLAEYFTKRIQEAGGEVVLQQNYSSGDVDFKSQLTAIRAKSPSAIFIPGYYTDVALIARQARELGIQSPLLGGDGWASPKLLEIAGQSINNSYYSSHYSSDDPSQFIQTFVSHFKNKFHSVPNGLSALGYDSAGVMIAAMKQTSNLLPKEIQESLTKTHNYNGITGRITIDLNRNAIKSAVILKVEHGQFKTFLKTE